MEWLCYGMVPYAAELSEVPLLCWSKITWLQKPGVEKLMEKLWCEFGPDTGFSQWRAVASCPSWGRSYAFTPGMEPRQKEHCLRVSLPSPGTTSQGSQPLKCLCLVRGPCKHQAGPVWSLTAVGEAEIVNRMRPGACGPPVEWSEGEFDSFHPLSHLASL